MLLALTGWNSFSRCCNLRERGFCGGVDVFATPADGKEAAFTKHFKLHNGSWKPKEGEEGRALWVLWRGTWCLCQVSCCREVPAGQGSEERAPVGLTLLVLVVLLLTPLCSSCGTESIGLLSVSVSPAHPAPGAAGGVWRRSVPFLPVLGQNWIGEMRLLSFPLHAVSEIAVYTLMEESYDSFQITVLEAEEIFFHDVFFVLILSFLLEESEHYVDSQMFHHLHNERRGEGYRAFLPVGLFLWFWCGSRALLRILCLHKASSPLEETGLRVRQWCP